MEPSDHPQAARAATAERERLFRLLVTGVREYAIFMLDPDGTVASWNEGAQRIKRYAAEEIVGRHFSVFYTPEDRAAGVPADALATARREGRVEMEGWRVRSDGSKFWAHVSLTEIHDDDGSAVGFAKVTRDLTDRRERELEVERQRQRYRALYENNPTIFITTDAAGTILHANVYGAIAMGYDPDDLVGTPAIDLVHPDDRAAFRDHLAATLHSAGAVERHVFRKLCRDGTIIWVRESARAVPGDGDDVVVLNVCEDITAQKQAEQNLHFLVDAGRVLASTIEYDTTLRSVAELVVSHLSDWCVVDVVEDGEIRRVAIAHADPSMEPVAQEYLRRFPPQPDAPHGAARVIRTGEAELFPEITEAAIQEMARDADHLEMLRRLKLRSGISVPMRLGERVIGAITLICSDDRRAYGPEDVTLAELLAARAALAVDKARLFAEAREASTIRDETLSIVSHDLRNPLNTILMSASFLCEILTEEEAATTRKQLEIIRRSAMQMNRLIQDLLDIARIEAGRLPIERAPLEPRHLLTEACDSLRPLAEGKGLTLHCEAADGLPVAFLDRDRMLQVFSNLVGNAVKFTPAGGSIHVRAEPADGAIRFAVRDTGTGIAQEDVPHLFDRFYQAKHTRRGGAGLGLSIVCGIIDAHGGQIRVDSTPGEGTTFDFTVPVDGRG